MNLSLYEADPNTPAFRTLLQVLQLSATSFGGTEVAFNQAELDAAQLDPVVFPTPDTERSPAGPSWIQIANEGGFLPRRGGPAPADHLDHRPDPVRRRQRGPALAAPRPGGAGGRDRRLLAARGQDADPLQRRPRGVPGARPQLRLLHGCSGPEPERRAGPSWPAMGQYSDRHADQGQAGHRRRPGGGSIRPAEAAAGVRAPR